MKSYTPSFLCLLCVYNAIIMMLTQLVKDETDSHSEPFHSLSRDFGYLGCWNEGIATIQNTTVFVPRGITQWSLSSPTIFLSTTPRVKNMLFSLNERQSWRMEVCHCLTEETNMFCLSFTLFFTETVFNQEWESQVLWPSSHTAMGLVQPLHWWTPNLELPHTNTCTVCDCFWKACEMCQVYCEQ